MVVEFLPTKIEQRFFRTLVVSVFCGDEELPSYFGDENKPSKGSGFLNNYTVVKVDGGVP